MGKTDATEVVSSAAGCLVVEGCDCVVVWTDCAGFVSTEDGSLDAAGAVNNGPVEEPGN